MTAIRFEDLVLSPEIRKAVLEMGFEETTPIQGKAIPVLLAGRDVIGLAQTGTGKTVAFGIPLVEKIDIKNRTVQAIILCPTRELAIQVSEEIQKLVKFKPGVSVLPVYGGSPIDRQIRAFRQGVHVVIGTPGRVMDHIDRKSLQLGDIKMVVLDEADEMLNMGFREDIETILQHVPEERQTVFFSATMPKTILNLTKAYQKNPEMVQIEHKQMTVPNIEQRYLELPERSKIEALSRLIDVYEPQLSLVFCNTKRKVNDVISELQARGYFADGLHGDLKQNERNAVLDKFKKGIIDVLVATDVAARGLDVELVEAVFNYDVPLDEESYVHRIGRTGRAGKSGRSFTFVTSREQYQLRDIERYTRSKIIIHKMPTLSDVEEKKSNAMIEKIKQVIEEGGLTKYAQIVENLLTENYSSVDVAAALVKMSLGTESKTDVESASAADFSNTGASSGGMARLFINVGRKQGIRPNDVVGAIAGETGIPGKLIGSIDIYEDFTFVEVPQEKASEVLTAMQNNQIKGKKVSIQPARKRT